MTGQVPRFSVGSDSARTAKYRRLQSWYREYLLDVPPGPDDQGNLRGNFLPQQAVEADSSLNFMRDTQVAAYARDRILQVQAEGGRIHVDRLMRNLLSSMPLCFNLFGYLRAVPQEAASGVLSKALQLDVTAVESIECEWGDKQLLGEGSAFDAMVWFRDSQGARSFLGIETKYTDSFSSTVYPKAGQQRPRYGELTEGPGTPFVEGAYERMQDPRVNQLWRSYLLMLAVSEKTGAPGHVVLSCCGDDTEAAAGFGLLRDNLTVRDRLHLLPHERLVEAMEQNQATKVRGGELRERYVDVERVDAMSARGSGRS